MKRAGRWLLRGTESLSGERRVVWIGEPEELRKHDRYRKSDRRRSENMQHGIMGNSQNCAGHPREGDQQYRREVGAGQDILPPGHLVLGGHRVTERRPEKTAW